MTKILSKSLLKLRDVDLDKSVAWTVSWSLMLINEATSSTKLHEMVLYLALFLALNQKLSWSDLLAI